MEILALIAKAKCKGETKIVLPKNEVEEFIKNSESSFCGNIEQGQIHMGGIDIEFGVP